MILRILIFFLLSVSVFAQNVATIGAFDGGLNLATDHIRLQPNEALELDNFVLDKFGGLHKRWGVKNWNDSLISADMILDIHYLEDKNGDKMLFIATDNYIYEAKSWEDVDSMATWDSLNANGTGTIIDYTRGQIDTAISGQKYIYGDTTSWILVALPNDKIIIGDSTYSIDSVLTDTTLHVTGTVATHGGESYRLLKSIRGNPLLSSYNGNLYVADDLNEPWWYDGIQPFNLGIIDSGIVDSVQVLSEPSNYYGQDRAGLISRTSREFPMWFNTSGVSLDSIQPGDKLHLAVLSLNDYLVHYFDTEIQEENANNNTFRIDLFPGAGQYWRPPFQSDGEVPTAFYGIDNSDYDFGLGDGLFWITEGETWADSRAPAAIFDSSKSWLYEDYQGFLLMNGKDATRGAPIVSNNPTAISYDSLDGSFDFAIGDQYYIAWQAPHLINKIVNFDWYWYNLDSVFVNEIYFSQIYFHRNRLYAIGREIIRHTIEYDRWNVFTAGDTTSTGRVWFSDLGRMGYIPSDFNFDIYGANPYGENISIFSSDAANRLFVLRDDLYLLTQSNIYRISGEPDPGPEDLFISQVLSGIGTNQSNGVVTTRDNEAYIMNQQGIWKFNGNNIQKISFKVDSLVERYRNSNMVAGQFKDNIYFSYPDSDITIVLHEPTGGFTRWDVGMQTINNQFVAIDSNYFLFAKATDSAFVLQYPRPGLGFFDQFGLPAESVNYPISYKSGWMDFGHLLSRKTLEYGYYTISKGDGSLFFNLNKDFADSTINADTTTANGYSFRRFRLNTMGDYFQVEINGSVGQDLTLSRIQFQWNPNKYGK